MKVSELGKYIDLRKKIEPNGPMSSSPKFRIVCLEEALLTLEITVSEGEVKENAIEGFSLALSVLRNAIEDEKYFIAQKCDTSFHFKEELE